MPPSNQWIDQINAVNHGILNLVRDYGDAIEGFKNAILYYFMLPLRIGMVGAVTPVSWGIALTPTVIAIYVIILAIIAGALACASAGGRHSRSSSAAPSSITASQVSPGPPSSP